MFPCIHSRYDYITYVFRGRRSRTASARYKWVAQDERRKVRAYGGLQAPRRRIPITATPRNFLAEFMDEQVWDLMVRMTTMKAYHKRQAGQHKGVWQPIDILEMQAFVGMIIITGIVRLPRLAMYWDTSSSLCMTPGLLIDF